MAFKLIWSSFSGEIGGLRDSFWWPIQYRLHPTIQRKIIAGKNKTVITLLRLRLPLRIVNSAPDALGANFQNKLCLPKIQICSQLFDKSRNSKSCATKSELSVTKKRKDGKASIFSCFLLLLYPSVSLLQLPLRVSLALRNISAQRFHSRKDPQLQRQVRIPRTCIFHLSFPKINACLRTLTYIL